MIAHTRSIRRSLRPSSAGSLGILAAVLVVVLLGLPSPGVIASTPPARPSDALAVGEPSGGPGGLPTPAARGLGPAVPFGCARDCPGPLNPHPSTSGNSSPVGTTGSMIATIGVGTDPYGSVYDPATGDIYVTNAMSDNVSVIQGTRVIASVAVGDDPVSATYDPSSGDVYISNENGNNLTILHGTKVVGWVNDGSFSGPLQAAYDPEDGLLYVPNVNANTVTLINKTKFAGELTAGGGAAAALYDPANQCVYVSAVRKPSNGGSVVTVYNNTTTVTTLTTPFQDPIGMAYDPANGEVYVLNQNLSDTARSFVVVLSGTTEVGVIQDGALYYGAVYDPWNSEVYGADYGTGKLTVVTNDTFVAYISVNGTPYWPSIDPVNGLIYVPDGSLSAVSVVSTVMEEGPATGTASGGATGTIDVNQSVAFNATLPRQGTPPEVPEVATSPAGGLACGPASFAVADGMEEVAASCVGTEPGTYTIWLNVTDASGRSTWAYTTWTVDPDPTAMVPVATAGGPPLHLVDARQLVDLSVAIQPGSGVVGSVVWQGLPAGTCSLAGPALPGTLLGCRFGIQGNLTILVRFNDTNGLSALSAPLYLGVAPDPTVGAPVASPARVDAGQVVEFTATTTGGSGKISAYQWSGLDAADCSGLNTSRPSCDFPAATSLSVALSVTDSNNVSSPTGPSLAFTVDPLLGSAPPTSNRAIADVGQTVNFTVAPSGGDGNYTYAWTGLPSGCSGSTGPWIGCLLETPGTVSVRVTVADTNGASVGPLGPVNVAVVSDPTVGAVTLIPPTVALGGAVSIGVQVVGGAGSDRYVWSGLPPGCPAANHSELSCQPTRLGSFPISLNLTDANGETAYANASILTVVSAPAPSGGGSPVAPLELVGVGVVVVVVALAVVVLALRGRAAPPRRP